MSDEHIYVTHPDQFAQAMAKAVPAADMSGNRQVIHDHAYSGDGCPLGCVKTVVYPRGVAS